MYLLTVGEFHAQKFHAQKFTHCISQSFKILSHSLDILTEVLLMAKPLRYYDFSFYPVATFLYHKTYNMPSLVCLSFVWHFPSSQLWLSNCTQSPTCEIEQAH